MLYNIIWSILYIDNIRWIIADNVSAFNGFRPLQLISTLAHQTRNILENFETTTNSTDHGKVSRVRLVFTTKI